MAPRTVIGTPLYNHAAHLEEALDSLLAQTERDFALVLVDDVSTDETPYIARRYSERDPRVIYHRNVERLGLVRNWHRAFELGRERFPHARYFAWGSDHDVWHPRWLESMLEELERSPEAVLVYPVCERISTEGHLSHRRAALDTAGLRDPAARVRACYQGMHAGDMVYGLVRAESMQRAGVFRRVLEPDRLLMAELSLQGEFRRVPLPLWRRRFLKSKGRARQRRAIFPRRRPGHSWLPPWVVRPAVFFWVYGIRGNPAVVASRSQGLRLSGTYARATAAHVLHRHGHRLRRRWGRLRKRVARGGKAVVRPPRRWIGRRLREGGKAASLLRLGAILVLLVIALAAFATVAFAVARVVGSADVDLLNGTRGADAMRAQAGDDVLDGRAGDDELEGGGGDDRLLGEGGNDTLYAGRGRDHSTGGAGNDVLWAQTIGDVAGRRDLNGDTVEGDAGDDVLHVRDGEADRVACGPGRDRLLADRLDVITDATRRSPNGSCESVTR